MQHRPALHSPPARAGLKRSVENGIDRLHYLLRPSRRLRGRPRRPLTIGMAVLIHERPEALRICLDSLFNTSLHDYDVTFLLHDDGSTDPRVGEIMDRERDPAYQVVRYRRPKGHNSWGAAFNSAMLKLRELGGFSIVGSCDADALFHPEWLDATMKIALWAKEHHCKHILGPFSSFNSSDQSFHKIMGTYDSPFGRYVVKRRMGALNYFYFAEDLERLGLYEKSRDDETLMTERFRRQRVRYFSTETSYVEHIGTESILDHWRPHKVGTNIVYGRNLAPEGWPDSLRRVGTLGYYKYVEPRRSLREGVKSALALEVFVMCQGIDDGIALAALRSIREHLKHPLKGLSVIVEDEHQGQRLCTRSDTRFIVKASSSASFCAGTGDAVGYEITVLTLDEHSRADEFLLVGGGTILMADQVFEIDGKRLFLYGDYRGTTNHGYRNLTALRPTRSLPLADHVMLFSKCHLTALKRRIEESSTIDWRRRVVSEGSRGGRISAHQLYGNWVAHCTPPRCHYEYAFNLRIPPARYRSHGTRLSTPLGTTRSITVAP